MSNVFCIAAEFETPEALIAACEKTRDAGFKKFESYTAVPGPRGWPTRWG